MINLKNNIKKINGYILLNGGQLYDSYTGLYEKLDILIKDGLISKIDKNIKSKSEYEIIDCKNKIVTNGFVDIHSHFREPGFEYKESLYSGSISAFYGGYTRVCVMPNTDPVIDSPELVEYIINKSKELPVYIYPIGTITKGQKGIELSEIGGMVDSGAVAISDDGIAILNSQILRSALEYSKKFNIPVINHAEDLSLVNEGLMNEGINSLKLGLPGNPDISESTMVYRDLSIAQFVSGKIHVPHVSTKKSVEIIRKFKNQGFKLTSEGTPHHLSLTDCSLLDYDTNAKVAPPLRTDLDRIALIEGIKDGTIDCIATDHAPHSIDDKEKDIKHAPCGMIGLESAFGLVNKELKKEKLDIKSILDLFIKNPSNILKIPSNNIKMGELAELNIIDPDLSWVFKNKDIKSKSLNSAVIGNELVGKVLATVNKGFILQKNK